MTSLRHLCSLRRSLLAATVLTAAGTAQAQTVERPTGYELSPGIIVNNDLNPNAGGPGGALDLDGQTVGLATGVTGIGQMTVRPSPLSTGMSVCSGTLINPRTVIFAAHCVNTRAANAYGLNGTPTGLYTDRGVPIAFGFGTDNLPAVRQWLGLASTAGGTDADPALLHSTNENRALYSVEEVWYDPRSLALGPNLNFIHADVAIATLDTPAFDIPTWTMLFSPLTEQTHSLSVGYGVSGTSASAQGTGCPAPFNNCGPLGPIDFRRRAAENVLAVLGSLDDRDDWLFGPADPFFFQSLYMQDFDSPGGQATYNPATGNYDFDIFNGGALPREGTTAGGDSGGPLVIDQKFDKPVIAGVLSGGSRFFNAQRFSTYGTHNFYQPLFLFWDVIVANNPYVYAGNKAGDGAWEDGAHWIQLMDPNYAVERNGGLVNDLPDTPALGVSGNTVKFGEVCFLDDCTDLADDDTATPAPSGSGTGLVIAGGPGSTGFVPNNRSASPKDGIRARYYDVTLSAAGTTTLGSSVTIDKLTLDGPTKLDIGSAGSLRVLGDYSQFNGWTNVDGLLHTGEALIATGFLTGQGTLRAPFTTTLAAIIAPGGADTTGTLTVDGNLIVGSGSALFIDASRSGADQLAVTGSLLLSANAQGVGPALVMSKNGAAPRHGQSFTIATAGGGLTGTFGNIFSFQGVLRPELVYNPNSIVANIRAGSLAKQIGQSGATERAFAQALDQLRGNFYDNLYGLYGVIDLMDAQSLRMTLRNLAPDIAGEARSLQDDQSRVMLNGIGDRLSMLGTPAAAGKLSVVGAPEALALLGSQGGLETVNAHGSMGLAPTGRSLGSLPKGFSGFVSGGFTANGAMLDGGRAAFRGGQRSWHIGMGLEMQVAEGATLGTAFGFADGYSLQGEAGARADTRSSQVAVYGSYQLGGGFYLGGIAAAEQGRASYERSASSGEALYDLTGATKSSRYTATAEAGVNLGIGRGLTLTPRVGVGYSAYRLEGFREGGGELALELDDLNVRQLNGRIGAKLSGATRIGGWTLLPQLQADMVQNLSGSGDGLEVRFASARDVAIALPLANGDTSWAEVKGGLKLSNGPFEFGAGLETSIGRANYRDDRATADFVFRF